MKNKKPLTSLRPGQRYRFVATFEDQEFAGIEVDEVVAQLTDGRYLVNVAGETICVEAGELEELACLVV